jgi:hypothetical protein
MRKQKRRAFVQTSARALAVGLTPALASLCAGANSRHISPDLNVVRKAPTASADERKRPLRLGLIIGIGQNPDAAMAKVRDLGLPTAQVFVGEFEPGLVERLRQALDKHGIEPTALVVGGPGKEIWDFY